MSTAEHSEPSASVMSATNPTSHACSSRVWRPDCRFQRRSSAWPSRRVRGFSIACWYVGLTALTLVLAYVGHGLRRPSGRLIIAAYLVFVIVLLATT